MGARRRDARKGRIPVPAPAEELRRAPERAKPLGERKRGI